MQCYQVRQVLQDYEHKLVSSYRWTEFVER